MTTTQRLKSGLAAYLLEARPSEDIAVVDATQRAEIALPTLAVQVTNATPHSVALANVQRCTVEIRLRCHAGDESDADVDNWIDQIESCLNDPAEIKAFVNDEIRVDHWLYNGSTTDWDENLLEVTFEAECLATRI